jgi:hypothetical protein
MTPTEDRKPEKKASDAIRDLGENARETASRAQQSTARATEGIRDYQLKVVAAAQENANAFFEYAQEAVEARSISDLIELSTAHTRRQVEMMSKQAQELAASAQNIAAGTAWPMAGLFGSKGAQIS